MDLSEFKASLDYRVSSRTVKVVTLRNLVSKKSKKGKKIKRVLWELLWPIAFKIPAHLGMVSYIINAAVKHGLSLLLLALASSC